MLTYYGKDFYVESFKKWKNEDIFVFFKSMLLCGEYKIVQMTKMDTHILGKNIFMYSVMLSKFF